MALSALQKAGRIILVGIDSSDVYVDSLRHKQLHGLVVQDPFRMGELGVKTLVDHLTGKSVPKRVDTGATMVTLENMDRPEIQKLLRPPGARYLSASGRAKTVFALDRSGSRVFRTSFRRR